MRGHLRGLGNNSDVQVAQTIPLGADAFPGFAQQLAAIGTFEGRVSIREQLADIPQCRRAQQGISRGVQCYVAIGVGQQAFFIRNTNATDHQRAFAAKFVYIKTVTDTHDALLNCPTELSKRPPAPNLPGA
ncbi:hypothetical protein D3C78_1413270 [compost metagenome]